MKLLANLSTSKCRKLFQTFFFFLLLQLSNNDAVIARYDDAVIARYDDAVIARCDDAVIARCDDAVIARCDDFLPEVLLRTTESWKDVMTLN